MGSALMPARGTPTKRMANPRGWPNVQRKKGGLPVMATAHPKRDIDPATPLHKFPDHLLLSTVRRLGELGFDASLAEAIQEPESEERVRRYLESLRRSLVMERAAARERSRLIHGLYTPPDQQLANVRKWNVKCNWGIPEEWFEALGPAPAWPMDSRLACVVLEVALPGKDGIPGHNRTFNGLWEIMLSQHPRGGLDAPSLLNAEHLFLLEGVPYEPGLRWRILDLGANWDKTDGIRPVDVRNPLTSPNVDGVAVLAHHPRFVRGMDGTTIPFLWISGFVCSLLGDVPRRGVRGVPSAGFSREWREGRVYLSAGEDDCRLPRYSVPVRRESKRAA